MDIGEASLLVNQLAAFQAEVHQVHDKLNETRLDMAAQLHSLDKEVRQSMHQAEQRFLERISKCEQRLVSIDELTWVVERLDGAINRMQVRLDDAIVRGASPRTDGVVINNNPHIDAGLQVDKIDRVDGDVFQGEKHE